jgi:hypothetical protein
MDIDKIIEAKYSEHQLELYNLEKNLEEYKEKIWNNGKIVKRDINSERQIKIEEGYYKFVKSLKLLGFEHWGYSEPPLMKPKYPIIPGATSDWDFSTTSWELYTPQYHSSPSSFRFTEGINLWEPGRGALCKYTGTTNLPQGRIKTWLARVVDYAAGFVIHFRNQSSVGSVSFSYGYYISRTFYAATGTYRRLYKDNTQIKSESASNLSGSLNTWVNYQVTWWIDSGGAGLMIRLESPPGTKDGPDWNDSGNKYATSSINRCGIGTIANSINAMAHDDTEIWGP